MEKREEGEIVRKNKERGGGLFGRETERERVWREDREMDRITGFKSRTERDKKKRRDRGKEHSG